MTMPTVVTAFLLRGLRLGRIGCPWRSFGYARSGRSCSCTAHNEELPNSPGNAVVVGGKDMIEDIRLGHTHQTVNQDQAAREGVLEAKPRVGRGDRLHDWF
jgi:hypothetical protein